MIYLDQAATSWPKPSCVLEAVEQALSEPWGNPGRSSHKEAFHAVERVLECRQSLATLFQAKDPLRFCFTSNATEALNLAIKGVLGPGDHAICSSMEHNAVWRPLVALRKHGIEFSLAQADQYGQVSVDSILKELRPNTKLVCILHASNVCGAINPIGEIGEALRDKPCLFLVDASQSAGCLPIDVEQMYIDLLAFPGHKALLGPQGTGGLYIREGITLLPMKEGGTGSDSAAESIPKLMPDRYETGTINTPGIAGLGASVSYLLRHGITKISQEDHELTQLLLQELSIIPGIQLYGPPIGMRRAPVVSFTFKGRSCVAIGERLTSRFDITSRVGLHCAYLAHQTLGTVQSGTIRFSLGQGNTAKDIYEAARALK